MSTFDEDRCEVGGCACAIWNDWLWARVEFAQQHPRAAEFADVTDEDARMDAEDQLIAELDQAGELPGFEVPPCPRAGCHYAGPS